MAGKKKVKPEGVANAVASALNEYRLLTESALADAIDATSKEAVSKTKGAAPKKTGKYAKGWSSKVTTKPGRGKYGRTVYQRTRPGLAHLLQHGHDGPQPAGPHPHIITDAEIGELLEENLEKEMDKT